jgi:NADPH:quinone reductase-like Zn-dependent oxidoreductase
MIGASRRERQADGPMFGVTPQGSVVRMPRSVQFSEHGEPDVLRVVEVPEPEPEPGQVRLAVKAAALNPFDLKVLRGRIPGMPRSLPAGLGSDVAGVVDAIGDGVTAPAVGDEVLGRSVTPAYATAALARADTLVHRPRELPWEVAAGLGVAGATAWAVLERLGVGEGDTLLVHAAAGGVGTFAVQLALVRGARVIGTASEANHELLRGWGAVPVLYGEGLGDRVREVAPEGVDAVLDASGRGELPLSVELAGGPERVLTIAGFDDVPEGVMRYQGGAPGPETAIALAEIVELVRDGRLQVPIAATYPLDEAGAALEALADGHHAGKIVLVTS